MTSAVHFVDAWIPRLVEPGSVLLLNNATDDPAANSSYCALLTCPSCGRMELLTEEQFTGHEPVTCGGAGCPAQFFLQDGTPMVEVGES